MKKYEKIPEHKIPEVLANALAAVANIRDIYRTDPVAEVMTFLVENDGKRLDKRLCGKLRERLCQRGSDEAEVRLHEGRLSVTIQGREHSWLVVPFGVEGCWTIDAQHVQRVLSGYANHTGERQQWQRENEGKIEGKVSEAVSEFQNVCEAMSRYMDKIRELGHYGPSVGKAIVSAAREIFI